MANRLPEELIKQLEQIPLVEVMEHNGHAAARRTRKETFYLCPFHADGDPSFKVDNHPAPGHDKPGYYCFACAETNPRAKGYGALMLQAALWGVNLDEGDNFRRVATELMKMANLVVDGKPANGFFHRARKASAPSKEITYTLKPDFSHAELRALGCTVQQVFRRDYNNPDTETIQCDANGKPLYKYSWCRDFYKSDAPATPFDGKLLHERFNLYAVQNFITEQGEGGSYEVQATETYPIFAFLYKDKQGSWSRKYEPYFKPEVDKNGKAGPSYKFTWWFEGGQRRTGNELSKKIYGDADVMRALETGTVETQCEFHPICQVRERDGRNIQTRTKFSKLVICSGPRDAINTYFHSDAHVCWPHSEGVAISPKVITALQKIADEVFILYDIDKTGVERANKLSLDFLELKTIYLPRDLVKLRSPRTGKPCKDAEEYFNYYPSMLRQQKKSVNINEHFASLLKSAKAKKFWDAVSRKRKNEWGEEEIHYRYTPLIDRMCQFLAAKGLHRYKKDDVVRYVYISEGGKVEIIPNKEIETKAKEIMKQYLNESLYYGDEGLLNAISTAQGINAKTMAEIPLIDLDFESWGEHFDYFFFDNTAVEVTADEIKQVPYALMPYHVNRKAILENVDYEPIDISRYFEIIPNPSLKEEEKIYLQRRYDMNKLLAETTDPDLRQRHISQIKQLAAEYKAWEQLYKYQVVWKKAIDECPPLLQAIYDMSRMYWRKEEACIPLLPNEQQLQDAHFINKILGLGYMLSRFRTDTRQQMVMITDYSVAKEGSPSGRTGKTMFIHLLHLVRKCMEISGKDYRKDPGAMAQNFSDFQQTVHSCVAIDDLDASISAESFYNNVSRLSVRNLYENTVRLDPDVSPKIAITMNEPFNLNQPSTYGRTWPIFVSDYYHVGDLSGEQEERTPETKFGYNIIKSASDEERMFNVNLMVYCLQCYLRFIRQDKGVMRAPIGEEAAMRLVYQEFKDGDRKFFREWAQKFFQNPWHFERPIAVNEMILSYYDELGKSIRKGELGKKATQFRRDLEEYCKLRGFVINPPVVFSGAEDQRKGIVRRRAWVSVFDAEGYPVVPQQRTRDTGNVNPSCLYFYRRGEVPRNPKAVLHAPEKDEEMLWQQQNEYQE